MAHVAVILTSEQCGHCRVMRGTGRLLSGNEIKDKKPNLPGGYYYDSVFMKKLICADTESPKIRVINIHYKTFDANKGVSDISVFTLDTDNKTVKQTMLKEKGNKTNMALYSIGESGKVLMNNDIDKSWSEIVSEYIPVNIMSYAFFFPSMIIFEGKNWIEGISNKKPIFGFLNGFESNEKLPYGAIPGPQPMTMEWPKFLKQFFDGTKELRGPKTESVENIDSSKSDAPVVKEHRENIYKTEPEEIKQQNFENEIQAPKKDNVRRYTTPGGKKLGFKLYVVE